jgi:hypothetical protein
MKNKLIAAFLMLTAVPFFTSATITPQPTNAELLTHLKSIKAEFELGLTEIASMTTKMNEDLGQYYRDVENATIEFYNLLLKVELFSSAIDTMFNILCTQIKPLQEIKFPASSIAKGLIFNNDNFIENHKQEIESILTKYNKHDAQSQEKDASTLKERIANYFFISPDNAMIAQMVAGRETAFILLQKIDAKIAELNEQQ